MAVKKKAAPKKRSNEAMVTLSSSIKKGSMVTIVVSKPLTQKHFPKSVSKVVFGECSDLKVVSLTKSGVLTLDDDGNTVTIETKTGMMTFEDGTKAVVSAVTEQPTESEDSGGEGEESESTGGDDEIEYI